MSEQKTLEHPKSDRWRIGDLYAAKAIKLAFAGHYDHANHCADIARRERECAMAEDARDPAHE